MRTKSALPANHAAQPAARSAFGSDWGDSICTKIDCVASIVVVQSTLLPQLTFNHGLLGWQSKVSSNRRCAVMGLSQDHDNSGICIWHNGRCGSTVLTKMLHSDARFHSHGEVLESVSLQLGGAPAIKRYLEPLAEFGRVNRRHPSGLERVVEIKRRHLERLGLHPRTVRRALNVFGYRRHIVLLRRNSLRYFASIQVARARGNKWHVEAGESPPVTRICANVQELVRHIRDQSNFALHLERVLPFTTLRLSYEDDIERDPSVGYERICKYVGKTPKVIPASQGRTNPFALVDVIVNFTEVADCLNGTEFEWMLER